MYTSSISQQVEVFDYRNWCSFFREGTEV